MRKIIAVELATDEDGTWCAKAQVSYGVGATGSGDTPGQALMDLGEALDLLLDEMAEDRLAAL